MAQFEEESAADDVIVIYANGSSGIASVSSWDAADPLGGSRGDADYLLAVVADIATIAPTRAKFAITGFSAGALMTYRMLCDHADLIAAAVPYGAYYNESVIEHSLWPMTVPLLHMHGADDPKVNPITGTGDADHLYHFGVLSEYMSAVALRNAGSLSFMPDFTKIQSELSGANVEVVNATSSYVLLEGIGHYWPRAYHGSGPNGSAAVLAFVNQFAGDTIDSTPYETWLMNFPELSGAAAFREADPDGDRLPNLLEMIMGLDPGHSDLGSARYPDTSVGDNKLRLSFPVDSQYQPSTEEATITFYGMGASRVEGPWTRLEAYESSEGRYVVEVTLLDDSSYFLKLTARDADESP
ncbi:hypothetical protein QEH59_03350 [Coraliomargarita sp. SDUM461004]|uniref:Phospholipase/carboxylesterase/thioesterase domain-containing protein n=1 Tax=Thalassobacterium sedimentorum TaxID=3041258 RepID=A0ABU1AF68_9BACT|nr:hypothetical protein [Coraliomargarita sp. SDUM461004]MDQ8193445.1 hypothetical protein [Coraliomargarita sp. SDUM461004]